MGWGLAVTLGSIFAILVGGIMRPGPGTPGIGLAKKKSSPWRGRGRRRGITALTWYDNRAPRAASCQVVNGSYL